MVLGIPSCHSLKVPIAVGSASQSHQLSKAVALLHYITQVAHVSCMRKLQPLSNSSKNLRCGSQMKMRFDDLTRQYLSIEKMDRERFK
jgi:hypothetical protein